MSHPEQLMLINLTRQAFPQYFKDTKVLEVGSLDLNGSVRSFFADCDYTGVDVGEGPGVDVVVPGEDFDGPDEAFDMVLSCECMEHNPEWVATTQNMLRMLRPGGLFLLTCAAPGRAEHGTTRSKPEQSPFTVALGQEYYRNLDRDDFEGVSGLTAALEQRADWLNWKSRDFYLVGIKNDRVDGWDDYVTSVSTWVHDNRRAVDYIREGAMRVMGEERFLKLFPALKRAYQGVTRRSPTPLHGDSPSAP